MMHTSGQLKTSAVAGQTCLYCVQGCNPVRVQEDLWKGSCPNIAAGNREHGDCHDAVAQGLDSCVESRHHELAPAASKHGKGGL